MSRIDGEIQQWQVQNETYFFNCQKSEAEELFSWASDRSPLFPESFVMRGT